MISPKIACSHIPVFLGIRMRKTKTFNEDPDAIQLNDPVFFIIKSLFILGWGISKHLL